MSDATEQLSPAIRRVRAYFAPVNRAEKQPTIFDPAQNGSFDLDTPPAPWLDLGWIEGFERKCGTKIEPLRTGAPLKAEMQVRTEVEATVGFSFESWGKLQLALSSGSQQMNLLTVAPGSSNAGSGGTAVPAIALAPGSTATVLQIGAAAAPAFSPGSIVAADLDYTGQTGFIGSGVSGAYLSSALADVDYVRRITLNVGTVASIAAGALTLEGPLLAGTPTTEMKVSAVKGFCDREGSGFFQEWSGLFVGEGQQGERVIWHYPRLQVMQGPGESMTDLAGGYVKARLSAAFRALPVKDSVDGESVVCFRSYLS